MSLFCAPLKYEEGECTMKKTYMQTSEEVLQGLDSNAGGLTTQEAKKRL